MNAARPTARTDDHGDRFPGAVLASSAEPSAASPERLVRMHAAYVHKVNAVVAAGNDDLAQELAQSFDEESLGSRGTKASYDRRSAGRHTAGRGQGGRGPGRVGSFTRRSLERFDRYTLDVFNAGTPVRPREDRSA